MPNRKTLNLKPDPKPEKYGKRLKVLAGLDWIPKAYSFSYLETKLSENENNEFQDEFQISDKGVCQDKMYDDIQEEHLVLQVLYNLDEREKLIFCYQLLRDMGYQIDHASFAKTIGINRQRYMVWVKRMREKASSVINKERVKDK